jgi:lipopolysaccharide export system permease protein
MTRLTRYLTRLFTADALALFAVAAFLLFLVQCLRSFDVISVKGQDLLTLIGQVLLTMPTLAITFLHVCIGIGLARALTALQASNELQIIHSSRRTGSLFRAIGLYAIGGMLLVLLLTNILEPTTRKYFNAWSASIAADLVSRTLAPHRVIPVTPGVTIVIGSRGRNGQLGSFFADDTRSGLHRTYIAESATVAADAEGYVLQLTNGAIQYMTSDFSFSEISFARYDLAVERLTGNGGGVGGFDGVNTIDMVGNTLSAGRGLDGNVMFTLGQRVGEGFRILAICLLVTALAAFPHARRGGRDLPIEVIVLGAAFVERAVSAVVQSPFVLIPFSGSLLLAVVAGFILVFRFLRLPVGVPRRSTA